MSWEVAVIELGRSSFPTVWSLQRRLVAARAAGEGTDCLLFVEHPPVITCGRGAREVSRDESVAIPWYRIERGGGVTYHGPGQLIGYPILRLSGKRRDIHRYLRDLEEVIISTLHSFGLDATRKPGYTGVWVQDKKIASIGIAVKKWVTLHGFALNVSTDLSWFQRIQPCGMEGSVMTSLERLCDVPVPFKTVQRTLVTQFEQVFQLKTRTLQATDPWFSTLLDATTGIATVDLSVPR